MKKMYSAVFSLFTGIVMAQPVYLSEVIVVNSGIFEFNTPTDYVTVGSYDLNSTTYVDFDTIYNQSAQDILIEGDACYVLSEDSIIKYDLSNKMRLYAAGFDSLAGYGSGYSAKSFITTEHYLMVGAWYGASDHNVQVYNKSDLSFVQGITGIATGVSGLGVIGNNLYVGQNLTSGTWTDSAGYLAVVDLTHLTHVRDIEMNNNESEAGPFVIYDDKLYTFNPLSGTLGTYNPATDVFTHTNYTGGIMVISGAGNSLVHQNGTVYFRESAGIASRNLTTETDALAQPAIFHPAAFDRDSLSGNYYLTQTDYNTYGRMLIYDASNALIDSVELGISPENIAFRYVFTFGVDETSATVLNLFPNPSKNGFNLSGIQGASRLTIADLNGRVVHQQTIQAPSGQAWVDTKNLEKGGYIVKLHGPEGIRIGRWLKH